MKFNQMHFNVNQRIGQTHERKKKTKSSDRGWVGNRLGQTVCQTNKIVQENSLLRVAEHLINGFATTVG
jgi:hypothetical protein